MIPARYSRSRPIDPGLVNRFRDSVRTFVDRAPLSESVLILDGVGPGCPTPILLLALLGYQRVLELREIHVFSASTFSVLNFLAFHQGRFRLEESEVQEFNRTSQKTQGIVPVYTLFSLMVWKLLRRKHLFSGDLVEKQLRYSCGDEFCDMKVSDLPDNLFFWTYDLPHGEFARIHAACNLRDLSVGQMASAVAGWWMVYDPLVHEGSSYTDAIGGPRLRDALREFRTLDSNCLFLHMNKEGERGRTLYIKAHQGGSGKQRLFQDFLYFFLGVDNREVNEIVRMSLFEVEPV